MKKFILNMRSNLRAISYLLIGPEGDFSTQEIETAIINGYTTVSLGNQRLRTETAALLGCLTVALKAQ